MNYDYEQLVYTLAIFWEKNGCKTQYTVRVVGSSISVNVTQKSGEIPFQRVSTIFLTILSKCHNIYFIHTYKYVGTIIQVVSTT